MRYTVTSSTATNDMRRKRLVAESYGVTVEVLIAEILPKMAATACRRSALRKARSAAKKTLWACGVDVAALTAQHRAERPKHTRVATSAANRRVAGVIKKLNPRPPRPPRAPRQPEGSAP